MRRGDELYLNLFDDKWIAHTQGRRGHLDPLRRRQLADLDRAVGQHLSVRAVGEGRGRQRAAPRRRLAGLRTPSTLAEIRAQAAAPKSPCGDCSYNDGRCANECACEHYSATGRIDTPAPALCEHERVIVPIADRVGNALWREQNPVFLRKLYPRL